MIYVEYSERWDWYGMVLHVVWCKYRLVWYGTACSMVWYGAACSMVWYGAACSMVQVSALAHTKPILPQVLNASSGIAACSWTRFRAVSWACGSGVVVLGVGHWRLRLRSCWKEWTPASMHGVWAMASWQSTLRCNEVSGQWKNAWRGTHCNAHGALAVFQYRSTGLGRTIGAEGIK